MYIPLYREMPCFHVFHVFKRRKMQKLEIFNQINQNITNVPLRNRRRFELETKSFVDEIKKANNSRANNLFRIWTMRLQILQQLNPAKNSPLMLARKENEDINDYRDRTINAMEDL